MKTVTLPGGESVPALGQGTWQMGGARAHEEVAVLRAGFDLGMTLVDTAEWYGPAEGVVGKAIAGQRAKIFLVSKVQPGNATYRGTLQACERSLRKIGTDYLDMYLLHWRSSHPLEGTVRAFEELRQAGKIRYWGVSNFDCDDMLELTGLPGGEQCSTNQVLYNLGARGAEWDLLPLLQEDSMPLMAYTPLGDGRLLRNAAVRAVAERHAVTPAAIALAWTLRLPSVISIPKTSSLRHLEENAKALEITFSEEDLAELDAAYPPPDGPRPLETA